MKKIALVCIVLSVLLASCIPLPLVGMLVRPSPTPTVTMTLTPRPTRTPTPRPTFTPRPTATPAPQYVDIQQICHQQEGARFATEGYLFVPKEWHRTGGYFHLGLTARRKNYAATGSADLELWFSSVDSSPVSMMVLAADPDNVKPEDILFFRGGGFTTPGGEIIVVDLQGLFGNEGSHVSVAGRIFPGADLADCHMIVDAMS